MSHARNACRQIWINVCLPPPDHNMITSKESLRELKVRALRLTVAFLYATKHHLRDEHGVNHDDLRGLLPDSLSKFLQSSNITESQSPSCASPETVSGRNSPVHAGRPRILDVGTSKTFVEERTPLMKDQSHIIHFHEYPSSLPLPLPLMLVGRTLLVAVYTHRSVCLVSHMSLVEFCIISKSKGVLPP